MTIKVLSAMAVAATLLFSASNVQAEVDLRTRNQNTFTKKCEQSCDQKMEKKQACDKKQACEQKQKCEQKQQCDKKGEGKCEQKQQKKQQCGKGQCQK